MPIFGSRRNFSSSTAKSPSKKSVEKPVEKKRAESIFDRRSSIHARHLTRDFARNTRKDPYLTIPGVGKKIITGSTRAKAFQETFGDRSITKLGTIKALKELRNQARNAPTQADRIKARTYGKIIEKQTGVTRY